ncbi:MAG: site-2 protease family protein [Deltaproteobacteria bacterium]|nr:site-2 protease family protein [Deltaproteobacteria bacterium]
MNILLKISIWAVPVLFSIVIHEVSHGWMAYRLGDRTAKTMGRLTLNPLPHIDPVGTIILPLIMIILGGPVFGWAKPVPFNPYLFNPKVDIKKGTMMVALAGPLSNFTMAFAASFLFVFAQKFLSALPGLIYISLLQLAHALILINLILGSFNLVPIPPLDGSKVLMGLLPNKYAAHYLMLERYGFVLIMILLASGALSGIIMGPVRFLYRVFHLIPASLVGLI